MTAGAHTAAKSYTVYSADDGTVTVMFNGRRFKIASTVGRSLSARQLIASMILGQLFIDPSMSREDLAANVFAQLGSVLFASNNFQTEYRRTVSTCYHSNIWREAWLIEC